MNNKNEKTQKKTTYEKPVNLSGVPFKEVLGALLKTPKQDNKEVNKGEQNNED